MAELNNWKSTETCSYLLGKEIHLWRLPLDIQPFDEDHFRQILDSEEQARANRFHFERDRRRYILVRSHLKFLLAKYLDTTPETLHFSYNAFGKPELKNEAVHFNVSHSGQLGLLAFDSVQSLGVDVEFKRPDFGGVKIARRFFSEKEVRQLEQLPEHMQLEGFFNGWSRKESYIKAEGKGLAIPLSQFSVSLAPDAESVLLSTEHAPDNVYTYDLYNITAHPDYAAALTCRKHVEEIRMFAIESSYLF